MHAVCMCIDQQERLLQALEGLPELMAGYALRVCKHYEDEEEVECENEGSSGQPPTM